MSASMTLGPYCNDAVDAMNIINIIKWRVKMHGENMYFTLSFNSKAYYGGPKSYWNTPSKT